MLGELLSKLDPRSAVTLFGLCISVVSFFVDRWNSRAVAKRRREKELRQESRQRELEYLDRQLRCLYGPLFGMVSSSYGIYAAFKASAAQLLALPEGEKYSSRRIWETGRASVELAHLHRTWMVKVMKPVWTDIERRINANGDLFIGSEYPVPFLMMLTHICSWKLLMATWEGKDVLNDPAELPRHRNFAQLRFPQEYLEYVTTCYNVLQERKAKLLSQLRPETLSISALTSVHGGDAGTYFENARRRSSVSAGFGSTPLMGVRRRFPRSVGEGSDNKDGDGTVESSNAVKRLEKANPSPGSFKRSFF